jgi:hypothetical protein
MRKVLGLAVFVLAAAAMGAAAPAVSAEDEPQTCIRINNFPPPRDFQVCVPI